MHVSHCALRTWERYSDELMDGWVDERKSMILGQEKGEADDFSGTRGRCAVLRALVPYALNLDPLSFFRPSLASEYDQSCL